MTGGASGGPDPVVGKGVLAHGTVRPTAGVKFKLGPFELGEVPHLRMYRRNVEPKGSLVVKIERLDDKNRYWLAYYVQNFGVRTAGVTIFRLN